MNHFAKQERTHLQISHLVRCCTPPEREITGEGSVTFIYIKKKKKQVCGGGLCSPDSSRLSRQQRLNTAMLL